MSYLNLPWYAASKVYASHPPFNVSSLGGCDFGLMFFSTTPNAEQLALIQRQINQPIVFNILGKGWLVFGQKDDGSWGITKLDDTLFRGSRAELILTDCEAGKLLRHEGEVLPKAVWNDIASKRGHTILSNQFPRFCGSLSFNFSVRFAEQDKSAIRTLNDFFELLKKDPQAQYFFYEQFIYHMAEFTAIIDWSYTTIEHVKEGWRITLYFSEVSLRAEGGSLQAISPTSDADFVTVFIWFCQQYLRSLLESDEGRNIMKEYVLQPKREILKRQFLKITSPQNPFHVDYLKSTDKAHILGFVVARASSLWQRWENSKQDGAAIVRAYIDLQKLLESQSIPKTYLYKA